MTGVPAPTWEAAVGQPAAVAILRAALTHDEVAHAWLLVGPSGVGQQALSRALAAALNCPESDVPDEGCGVCSTCERIARGVHPAAADFEPEGASHVVDAVRGEWIPTASRTPAEGRRRVLRVVAADRMNDGAQNAFLKVLEEPPASLVWVLEVDDDRALLDTVVSRCRRLDLVPWGPDALVELAGRLGIPDDRRAALARAAMGSPARLRELADPEMAQARDTHLAIVERLANDGPGAVVPLAKELTGWARSRSAVVKERHATELAHLEEAYGVEGGRGWPPGVKPRLTRRFERVERQEQRRALDAVLDDLGSYVRDIVAAGSGAPAEALVNIDHLGQLQRDAGRLAPAGAMDVLEAVSDCREALERNAQPQLALERLLLRLAVPLYRAA